MSEAADDPIAQVCGVPAAEILARATPPPPPPEVTVPPAEAGRPPHFVPPRPRAWSLLDLGDGTREQFIEAAHRAILGRAAAPPELALRLAQLAQGRSRLGILLRLALSEEGRAVAAPPIRGPGLRAVHKLAPALVAIARLPMLRAARHAPRLRRRG